MTGQRHRRRLVIGNVEHRAVRHDAAHARWRSQQKFSGILVKLQLGQTIEMFTDAANALVRMVFQGTGLLLEMLGFDEQPLVPDDGVACSHG